MKVWISVDMEGISGLVRWAAAAEPSALRPARRGGFRMKTIVGSIRNVFSDLL